jgi:hypothetical protein
MGKPKKPEYVRRLGQVLAKELGFDQDNAQVYQENGQLMGNPLSFPILCVCNYVAYHVSWEQYLGRELTVKEVSQLHYVLINGDDILFRSNPEHYSVWKRVVDSVGLTPSVGKNFFHSRVAQINSELFIDDGREETVYSAPQWEIEVDSDLEVWDRHEPRDVSPETTADTIVGTTKFRKIPYVNMGLLTHRRKQECDDDYTLFTNRDFSNLTLDRLGNLPEIHDQICSGLSEEMATRALGVFWTHCRPFRQLFPELDWKRLQVPAPMTGVSVLLTYQLKSLAKRRHLGATFGSAFPNLMLLDSEADPKENYKKVKNIHAIPEGGMARLAPSRFHISHPVAEIVSI